MRATMLPIRPKRKMFDATRFIDEIKSNARDVADDIKAELDDVVSDWQTSVTFRARIVVQPDLVTIQVEAASNARIFNYVDKGTRPHIIRAKTRYGLRYRSFYSARTQPGIAHAGTGEHSGDWHNQPFVMHPGSAAREFTTQTLDKYRPEFKQAVDDAIHSANS